MWKAGLGIVKLVLASVKRRGWVRTLVFLKDETCFDLLFGTDTRAPVPVEGLAVAGDSKAFAQPYQATNWAVLKKLFPALIASGQIDPRKAHLLDFGCGKGRVLIGALHFGIRKVVGIEFDEQLCHICARNLRHYTTRRGLETEVTWEVVHGDATTYAIPPDANLFFLYNPFSGPVLDLVAQRIHDACRNSSNKPLVVYVNPKSSYVFERLGFVKSRQSDKEVAIYSAEFN